MRVPVYKGTFLKKDGERRTMLFSRLKDLPTEIYANKLKNSRKHNLDSGMELVWDWSVNDFRIFNSNKKIGEIVLEDYKEV